MVSLWHRLAQSLCLGPLLIYLRTKKTSRKPVWNPSKPLQTPANGTLSVIICGNLWFVFISFIVLLLAGLDHFFSFSNFWFFSDYLNMTKIDQTFNSVKLIKSYQIIKTQHGLCMNHRICGAGHLALLH